jgi:hypothetical protein
MNLAMVIAIVVGVVAVSAIVFGRPMTVSYKDLKASLDKNNENTAEIRRSVGEANGKGDLTQMHEKTLEQIEEIRVLLDARTHITRSGSTEPEELAKYTQSRLHDVLGALASIDLQLSTLWRVLQDDYDLPDLPPRTTAA